MVKNYFYTKVYFDNCSEIDIRIYYFDYEIIKKRKRLIVYVTKKITVPFNFQTKEVMWEYFYEALIQIQMLSKYDCYY